MNWLESDLLRKMMVGFEEIDLKLGRMNREMMSMAFIFSNFSLQFTSVDIQFI